jgi:hypothetical protein
MPVTVDLSKTARSCHQLGGPADGGILFKACDNQSKYKSLDAHQSASCTKHQKSVWSDKWSRADECHIFCEAKIRKWIDKNGDCWSVTREGDEDYGPRREIVAFFDAPQNDTDPWHGYPVGAKGLPIRRWPPDNLLKQWQGSGRITFTTFKQLHRRVR